MPFMIHTVTQEIGIEVAASGNPCIVGVDRETGFVVRVEINSQGWEAFKSACQRLDGVGIGQSRGGVFVPQNGSPLDGE